MSRADKFRRFLRALNHFLVFFALIAFVITSCMMLFISTLSRTTDFVSTRETISIAAKITFVNVLLLSLIATIIDNARRKLTIDRPAKKITDAAERLMQGDFSVRIKTGRYEIDDRFSEIAVCFNKMAEALSSTETLRADFIANVSHELKTPLAVMRNYATLLQQPNLDEGERREYAKAITDASHRLANLITNILKLNKLENQQISPVFKTFDLSEQVCQCLLEFENAWESKELNIETDIEDGILVRSDPEMLSLVWNNLFSNAIKFTDKGGSVLVAVRGKGDNVFVSVSDTGCGISPEVGERMFDKFYQGDTSHSTQGNGLGLSLVKRVIDITECDIAVESELGRGTTFTVRMRREV